MKANGEFVLEPIETKDLAERGEGETSEAAVDDAGTTVESVREDLETPQPGKGLQGTWTSEAGHENSFLGTKEEEVEDILPKEVRDIVGTGDEVKLDPSDVKLSEGQS